MTKHHGKHFAADRSGSFARGVLVSGRQYGKGHMFEPDAFTNLAGIPVHVNPMLPKGVSALLAGGVVYVRDTAAQERLAAQVEAYPDRLHSDEAHEVIAGELVACTLGQRVRPELMRHPAYPGGVVTRTEPLPVR
jgi:hypothetical protein